MDVFGCLDERLVLELGQAGQNILPLPGMWRYDGTGTVRNMMSPQGQDTYGLETRLCA